MFPAWGYDDILQHAVSHGFVVAAAHGKRNSSAIDEVQADWLIEFIDFVKTNVEDIAYANSNY